MITHVLEERDDRIELTDREASDLEYARVIYLCDGCSQAAIHRDGIYVYHTTIDWDEQCESEGTDPVDRALAQVRG